MQELGITCGSRSRKPKVPCTFQRVLFTCVILYWLIRLWFCRVWNRIFCSAPYTAYRGLTGASVKVTLGTVRSAWVPGH